MEHNNPNLEVPMTQNLRINGINRKFDHQKLPLYLTELLEQLGINKATVVAEIDGRVVECERFAETKLSSNSFVELVCFVPGG